jgi:hypothetical protein
MKYIHIFVARSMCVYTQYMYYITPSGRSSTSPHSAYARTPARACSHTPAPAYTHSQRTSSLVHEYSLLVAAHIHVRYAEVDE